MVPKTSLVEATDATAPLPGRDQQVAIPDGKNVIERLIHQYHGDVYRYGFRLSGNAADADDLAQQVFLAAHQKIGQLREMERARGWLLAITRNQFFKMYRRRRPVDSSSLELDVNQVLQNHDVMIVRVKGKLGLAEKLVFLHLLLFNHAERVMVKDK